MKIADMAATRLGTCFTDLPAVRFLKFPVVSRDEKVDKNGWSKKKKSERATEEVWRP